MEDWLVLLEMGIWAGNAMYCTSKIISGGPHGSLSQKVTLAVHVRATRAFRGDELLPLQIPPNLGRATPVCGPLLIVDLWGIGLGG